MTRTSPPSEVASGQEPGTARPGRDWRRTWGIRVLADRRFLGLAVGLVAALVLAYRGIQVVAWLGAPQWGYDFSAYWLAARHLVEGQPLYTATQIAGPYAPQGQGLYLYPPFLAVVMVPFGILFPDSYRLAAAAWFAVQAGIAGAGLWWLARTEGLSRSRPEGLLVLAGAFAFPPLVAELVLGNVHALLLGLFIVAWVGLRSGERGAEPRRDGPGPRFGEALAGMAVGLAVLVKVFPALLLVWFAASGRWRAAAWSVAAVVVGAGLTLPLAGAANWWNYPVALANLSAPADVTDALAPTVWLAGIVGFGVARLIVLVGAIALTVLAARQPARTGYGAAVALTVLAAPALFQHYLTILLLPLILAAAEWRAQPRRLAALGAAYLAMWPGEQALLGALAWVLNRAIPTLGALAVPATLLAWGRRGRSGQPP